MAQLELFTYCKSSATYRVRIALNYKGIDYEPHYVDLLKDGGDNFKLEYLDINPQGLIPTLIHNGQAIHQSVAILEFLEETFPEPALLPEDPHDRAYCRAIAQMIACEIHPLNNLRVLAYIENELGHKPEEKLQWYRHWLAEGFNAIESYLVKHRKHGPYCLGDTPTIADACLVPQVYNANRYECDMQPYPTIRGINEHCLVLQEFLNASPDKQDDFVR